MKKLLLPHPVLLPVGKDYEQKYGFEMSVGKAQHSLDGNILIPVEFNLQSAFIRNLWRNKKAKIIVLVKCSKMCRRASFEINNMSTKIVLPLYDYVDKITISPYITSTEKIKPFKSSEHHKEFAGMQISVPKGAILARGSDSVLTIDSLPTLNAAIRLMTENTLTDGEYRFDVTDDYIKIYMNKETRARIETLRGTSQGRLFPSVYMTVLTYAIQNIDDNAGRKWAESLKKTLEDNKIKTDDLIHDAYKHAQRLLKYPLEHIMEDAAAND